MINFKLLWQKIISIPCPTLYNNVSIWNEFFVSQMWWWVFCMINFYEFWYLEITINTSCIIITCLTTSKTDNASKYKAAPSGSPELSSLLERFLVATLDIYLLYYCFLRIGKVCSNAQLMLFLQRKALYWEEAKEPLLWLAHTRAKKGRERARKQGIPSLVV